MSSYPNLFTCDCHPGHLFPSLEEFDTHFQQFRHRFYECSSQLKMMEYHQLQDKLKKMTEERDRWRNKYFDECFKNDTLWQ